MSRPIATLINARWIVPVEPADVVLENHALAIQDGRIVDILPQADALIRYLPATCQNLDQHVLIPGLINAHTHASMTLLRGLADDLPLADWLQNHIWPTEARWVNPEFVADGTRLAIAEMLRSGTTCFNDMYFFAEVTAAAARECGIRACVGLIVLDFPTAYARDLQEYLDEGLALHQALETDPLLHTALAPHALYTVSRPSMERVGQLATDLDIPIHIHVHETAAEVTNFLTQQGCRPLQQLDQLGLLSSRLLAVHMTQLETAEIARLSQAGVHVIHCPESNLKLASGFCPIDKLNTAGVNIALGTDGAASNNDLNLLGEMRTAALLGKAVAGNASAWPAAQVLRMATLNAAQALGLADEIGSLRAGKAADVVAINLGYPETEPIFNPVSHLIYAVDRHQVSDVWVAGRQLLANGQLTTVDLAETVQRARDWGTRIRNSRVE